MWHWQNRTLHFLIIKKHPRKRHFGVGSRIPIYPHRFQQQLMPMAPAQATSQCTAWALQGIKRTTAWAPRNVAWQSTVSMLSDEHVKWQMPWEAPIGARCRRDLVGEISRWKERRKGTQKVGYVMWLIYFLYFVGVQVLLFDMFGIFSKHRGQAKPSTRWYVSFFGGLGPGK